MILKPDTQEIVRGLQKCFKYYLPMFFLWMYGYGYFGSNPIPNDYFVSWQVSDFIHKGTPAYVYEHNMLVHHGNTLLSSAPSTDWIYFLYPPSSLLLVWPLALLPHVLSWIAFVIATGWFLIRVLRQICDISLVLWVTLTAPAMLFNTINGQNGAFNAAMFGVALYYLNRRPIIAGIMVGVLTYKPHLVILFLLMLIVDKRWKSLISAVLTVAGSVLLTSLLYGVSIWGVWYNALQADAIDIAIVKLQAVKVVSVFGSAMTLGLSQEVSLGIHVLTALTVIMMVIRLWTKERVTFDIKAASLAFGTLIVTPYIHYHDYVLTLVGLAFWFCHATRTGWKAREFYLMIAVWCLPFWLCVSKYVHVPVPPMILFIVLVFFLRRGDDLYTPALEGTECAYASVHSPDKVSE